jgi:P-aminobenzoate N-oxygenase AurF
LPMVFFFGVLAGEVPIDHLQRKVLRDGNALHPIVEKVTAIHVAEEARHISFAHEYLSRRVPRMRRWSRFWLSLYVPVVMRVLCQAIVAPPRSFFRTFDVPRSVRGELFFDAPESRQTLRDMFGDIRMLCHDAGLMNPVARLLWRICKIDGRPSRYRSEPPAARQPTTTPHRAA